MKESVNPRAVRGSVRDGILSHFKNGFDKVLSNVRCRSSENGENKNDQIPECVSRQLGD